MHRFMFINKHTPSINNCKAFQCCINVFSPNRCIKVMWMIQETQIMLGWKQLQSISMMNQVKKKKLLKYQFHLNLLLVKQFFLLCSLHLGDSVSELPLQAGDDAGQVSWTDMDSSLAFYANHSQFLKTVAEERKAHW